MSLPSRPSSFLWVIAPLLALAFFSWLTAAGLHRVNFLTNLVETEVSISATSPTGYADGLRQMIVPEHNNESYQWIVQTQQMLAGGDWRVRYVTYDNAPIGRTILTPSLYRWCVGLVAEVDHLASGRPLGISVEQTARWVDPLIGVLLFLSAVIFVARRFGSLPACILAMALVTLFPFGGSFLAGQPDDKGLELFLIFWSVMLPVAGLFPRRETVPASGKHLPTSARISSWFFAGGVAGGLALWVDVVQAIPVLAGVALGGAAAEWCSRPTIKSNTSGTTQIALPWRHWALGGAVTSLAAYLLEYSPAHMGSLHLRENHPLYAIAWIGIGEILARVTARPQLKSDLKNWRTLAALVAAILSVAAVPVVMIKTGSQDLFTADPTADRLTNLPGSPLARNLWAWLRHDGITHAVVATCLPLLLFAPAAWLIRQKNTDWSHRAMLAFNSGPLLVTFGFACFQLRGWNSFDALLLVLATVTASGIQRVSGSAPLRWTWIACMVTVLIPGGVFLAEKAIAERRDSVTESDVEALVERHVAHWLARQAGPGGAVVLAPPNLTTSLIYHGGLSGLGTPFWENKDGFVASMRIASASSADEGQALAQRRNLKYIVVPSWDDFLDESARLGANQAEHALMASLHRWLPPRWLHPVPYHLPAVSGFEGQSVAVFEVVDLQDNATALSCLAEYFVEMNMIRQALGVASTLEHSFPADLGAAVARAIAVDASGNAAGFSRAMEDVQRLLSAGDGENIAWDRRVSLAIALVKGKQFEAAKEQVRRCLDEIDEPRLRLLSTISLHRLQVMSHGFGLEISDPQVRALAQQLLPAELRGQP